MSDIKRTIHIEIPAEATDEQVAGLRQAIEKVMGRTTTAWGWEPNEYSHSGACEDSDHCYGPGSNAEKAILVRAQQEPVFEYAVAPRYLTRTIPGMGLRWGHAEDAREELRTRGIEQQWYVIKRPIGSSIDAWEPVD